MSKLSLRTKNTKKVRFSLPRRDSDTTKKHEEKVNTSSKTNENAAEVHGTARYVNGTLILVCDDKSPKNRENRINSMSKS